MDSSEQSSREVLEQTLFLLNDEISYSETLRSSRNTIASLLAVLLGLGIFKVELWGAPGEVRKVDSGSLLVIRACLTGAVLCSLVGVLYLFTERPGRAAVSKEENENPVLKPANFQRNESSAAMAVMFLKPKFRKRIEEMPPNLAIKVRTRIAEIAYDRLSRKNRRVRYRIELGRRWLLGSLAFVMVAFVTYLWSESERGTEHATPESTQTESTAENEVEVAHD